MKLVRFQQGEHIIMGELRDDMVLPLVGMESMQDIIVAQSNKQPLPVADTSQGIPLAQGQLLAPIIPQRNVFCVGWNYLKHYDESVGKRGQYEVDLPDLPTFFSKVPTTIANPYDDLPLHQRYTQKLDWEIELGVIIGRAGRDIPEEEALSYVFGYCAANDISAREVQRAHGGQWFKGKSLDATCPLGPWVLTAADLPDPQDLTLRCWVNGELMQEGNTRQQIFSVARIIAELSAGLTLLPGDLILTGTPEGIGAARTPPVFLADGDVLEGEIEQLGRMKNTIIA